MICELGGIQVAFLLFFLYFLPFLDLMSFVLLVLSIIKHLVMCVLIRAI